MVETTPSRELLILREKAERLLGQAVDSFEQVGDRFEVPYQGTRIVVHPLDWTPGRTLLRIISPILRDVEAKPKLYERLSELNNTTIFGKYYVLKGTVYVEHNLLGEALESEEFRAVLASVAHHADHVVDALSAEFGGERWAGRG